MKCRIPSCNKQIPEGRVKDGYLTCSKKCASDWSWLPQKQREKIIGRKYKRKAK